MTTRFFIKGLMITCLTCLALVFGGGAVFAQSPTAEPQPAQSNAVKSKEKKASLSFEDELVEGGTQKPELFYLFQKKNFNYKRLIRLRDNFLPEMRKTAEDVQRTRGGS
jgi:hypothetical protein